MSSLFSLKSLVEAAGFRFGSKDQGMPEPLKLSSDLAYSKDVAKGPSSAKGGHPSLDDVEVLPEYELVRDLINRQFPLIFVTGGAGTGKSTFIHWLMREFKGRALLGAPTAMAAINIEGKTLHSLCSLPPAWILRQDIKEARRQEQIKRAEVLVIDEISMVTANLLDGVSAFLRRNRKVDKPFGGLPVVMVGDMFQLPPVVADDVRELFARVYGSPKFYNAKSLKGATYYAIELNKTFRQLDQHFVDLLTRLREGVELDAVIADLNSKATIQSEAPDGAVWLSPRNAEVNRRNREELAKIESTAKTYVGRITGQFKKDRLPSPLELKLKVGAQVMFTKNDSGRRWFNGAVGKVAHLSDDSVGVELSDTGTVVNVDIDKWEDFKYGWNSHSREIERDEVGCYHQLPLTLGWAITIHKSQGRTISRVHLDLGSGAFETGQTYVALSRCRTIDGLTMSRPLESSDVMVDEESKHFYARLRALIQSLPVTAMREKLDKSKSTDVPLG